MPRSKFSFDKKSGLYFIIFVVIVACILVYYFAVNPGSDEVNTNIEQPANLNANAKTKNNANKNSVSANENANISSGTGGENLNQNVSELGIEIFGYPDLVRSENGDIINLDMGDGNYVNVMPTDYEGMVRNSIGIEKEEAIYIDGVKGTKLTGGSAKDGSEVSLIIVTNNNRLYHFSGNESFLNSLDSFIKFN
ncbi:MAG: hypothetical protein WC752_02145 [Patescibacteria group bacterium]|jgi:hypothetical protein